MRTGIVIVVLAVIALAIFNPGMDDFRVFVGQQSEGLIRQEAGEGPLADFLAGVGGRFAADRVDRITDRTNYVIFSTYTIDFDGADRAEEEWRFLGIAGQFIETNRPQSLQQ